MPKGPNTYKTKVTEHKGANNSKKTANADKFWLDKWNKEGSAGQKPKPVPT